MKDDNKILEIKKYIEENYSLDIVNIEKVKRSYKISTKEKRYCLKSIEYNFGHFYFILSAMNHLLKNNFYDIPKFILKNDKKEYGLVNGKYSYLTEWIDSRVSNYDNPIELSLVSNELAKLHKCSQNFNIREEMNPRIGWFSWEKVFSTRLDEILDFKNRIYQKAHKCEFDLIYLENINKEIDRGKKSIEGLRKNNYISVMEKEVFKRGFCHHDYAHHNILVDKLGKIKVIDFDYCLLDSHLHDLASLMIRAMKDGKWDKRKADLILYSYEKILELRKDEIPIMREFIRFPQAFWQLGIQAYWERQPWSDEFYLNRLNKYLYDCTEREDFINSYFEGGD